MKKVIFSLLLLSSIAYASESRPGQGCCTNCGDSLKTSVDLSTNCEALKSRYLRKTDPVTYRLAGILLRSTWWSRPYEYAWASQFADSGLVVLDAACGISHPFKWHLGQTCSETWGCDKDARITRTEAILNETSKDLGEKAHTSLVNNPSLYNKVNLVKESICSLPDSMPQFDRIFCISSLGQMSIEDQEKALDEFARHLTPDGLVIITVEFPKMTPRRLFKLAEKAGLESAGDVELGMPPKDAIADKDFHSIYSAVLRRSH